MFCNLCGEEFFPELNNIKHLEEPMKGSKTVEQYCCKHCGIVLSEINAKKTANNKSCRTCSER